MKKFIPIISFTAILVACGYKGPLYLPKPTPAPKPVVVESQVMKESSVVESAMDYSLKSGDTSTS